MAAVATRTQQQNSPHTSTTVSRMGTRSPVDIKKNNVKVEEQGQKEAPAQSTVDTEKSSTLETEPPVSTSQSADQNDNRDPKAAVNAENSQALAPPPRPAQNPTDTPDYFSALHNNTHFSLEPNPFEQSFGNPSVETPGKSLLPPVAALTSPASLLPGGSSAGGFNWSNSLRSGPLSPAMLTGPTGASDYFDSHLRGGFPTPNESSLRTGLTPGGGGSMFPVPSPNSQALFNQLASGGATPSTLDFHRTAMSAAAARKSSQPIIQNNLPPTTQPTTQIDAGDMEQKPVVTQAPGQNPTDPFGQHDANDAANGLFLLAQARGAEPQNNQYAISGQNHPVHGLPVNGMNHMHNQMGSHVNETSPTLAKSGARNASVSIGSIDGSARGMSEMSGGMSDSGASEQMKPNAKGRNKKGSSSAKSGQTANGRRKAQETPSKPPPNKKAKGNNGSVNEMDSDDEGSLKQEGDSKDSSGRKMTDEEKRKNFLERNRVAALKCRQRKKQWLANLQAKVEIFSSENDALSAQVTQLREEIVNLKTLLLAHKDCPISQAQGLGGMAMNGVVGDFNPHANPYGISMANGAPVMAGQGMHRR